MRGQHTRVNDCGCIETWDAVPGCDPDRQTWAYGLQLGCAEHTRGHQEFLESMRNFRPDGTGDKTTRPS